MKEHFHWQRNLEEARARAECEVIAKIRQEEYQRGYERGKMEGGAALLKLREAAEQMAKALRIVDHDITRWADGERGHVLQDAHDMSVEVLAAYRKAVEER